jgi:putative acetyltransferase
VSDNPLIIREAAPDDRMAILDLTARAFGQLEEVNVIEKLERDGEIILELVAEKDGKIVGHILFYPIGVFKKLGAIGLGPMCVDPWMKRERIGTALVNRGLEFIRQSGASLVFVLGHDWFYPRFGFNVEATEEFETPYKGPHFFAIRFRYGPPMSGRLIFPDAFGTPSA